MAPQMATGVPPPAAPSRKAPKREADQDRLNARVGRQARRRAADDREQPRFDRHVVNQHGVEDRPADRQEAERGPVEQRGRGHAERHAVDNPGDQQGGEAPASPALGASMRIGTSSQNSTTTGKAANKVDSNTLWRGSRLC